MQLKRKLIYSFMLVAWLAHPIIAGKISGSVHSADGTPLANVEIYVGKDIPETKTTVDGSFVFEANWKVTTIFIAHPGFRPAAKLIDASSERYDFGLEPETISTWWIPTCEYEYPKTVLLQPYYIGPCLILPKGVKINTGSTDIDYRVDTIQYDSWWYKQWNTQELEFWIGSSAGGPIPPDYLFEQSKEFTLRFWRIKNMSLNGIDARGSDSKNRRWRHINIGSTSIMYRQASDKAAKFFDGIIDSMCMPAPNKVRKTRVL